MYFLTVFDFSIKHINKLTLKACLLVGFCGSIERLKSRQYELAR